MRLPTRDQCRAKRSRGTPRIANHLIRRIRDFCQVQRANEITTELVKEALQLLEVDEIGLDKGDQQYLNVLVNKFRGGPVGISTLASAMSEHPGTIEDVIEPFLLQKGFIKRTTQGRVATEKAFEHLGLEIKGKLL